MKYLRVKNWDRFQHYKQRCPPWIKLHVRVLNDRIFSSLSCACRGLLVQLWVLASENDGMVLYDLEEIRFRLRDGAIIDDDIKVLIKKGFMVVCKQMQADAVPETETETETETEKDISDFKFLKSVPLPKNLFLTERMKAYVKKQGCENSNWAEQLFEDFCIYQKKKGKKWQDWTLAYYSWVRNDKKIYHPDKYIILEPL